MIREGSFNKSIKLIKAQQMIQDISRIKVITIFMINQN